MCGDRMVQLILTTMFPVAIGINAKPISLRWALGFREISELAWQAERPTKAIRLMSRTPPASPKLMLHGRSARQNRLALERSNCCRTGRSEFA